MKLIGTFLRQRRKEKFLSLEEIAESTKIKKKYLEAIEEDDFDLLPDRLYQKIFIRAYAQELGISTQELNLKLDETQEWKLDNTPAVRRSRYFDLVFAGAGLLLGVIVFLILIHNPVSNGQTKGKNTLLGNLQSLFVTGLELTDATLVESSSDLLELKIESLGKTQAKILAGTDTLFEGVLRAGQTNSWKSWQGFYIILEKPRLVRLYLNGRLLSKAFTNSHSRLGLDLKQEDYTTLLNQKKKL